MAKKSQEGKESYSEKKITNIKCIHLYSVIDIFMKWTFSL